MSHKLGGGPDRSLKFLSKAFNDQMTAQAGSTCRKRTYEYTSASLSPVTSSDFEIYPPRPRVAESEWNRDNLCAAITNDLQARISGHVGTHTVRNHDLACFYDANEQNFDLRFYVDRLVEYCSACDASHVAAMTYLTRVRPRLPVTRKSVHRALAAVTLLAIKYLEDEIFDMEFYARVFGVDLEELIELEASMLDLLEWQLRIDDDEFEESNHCLRMRTSSILDI